MGGKAGGDLGCVWIVGERVAAAEHVPTIVRHLSRLSVSLLYQISAQKNQFHQISAQKISFIRLVHKKSVSSD